MAASFTLTAADFVRLQKIVGRRLQRKPGLSSALFSLRIAFCLCLGLAFAVYVGVLRKYPDVQDLRTVDAVAERDVLERDIAADRW